jgi:O-antigen ligase
MDWWCERGILLLVLAALVFAPLALGAVYVWSFLVLQGLALAVAALWILRLWAGYKPKLLWPPLTWVVAAFVAYAVGRYFTADIEYIARQEMIRILLYAFLFFAVASNLYRQESAEVIAFTLTAAAVLTSSYAIYQFLHHSNHVWDLTSPYPGRASGTYINPDHFAGFLELVLPLPLAFLLAGRISIVARVVLVYAGLVIIAGLAVTLSRGGALAGAAGVFMLLGFLMCHRNHRLRATLVLVVLLAGGGFVATHYLSQSVRFMRRMSTANETSSGALDTMARLQMWKAAGEMWRDHFWFGAGPGHFDYRFREYRPEGFQQRPDHAHNDYLELLADWGAVGGVIVFAGIGVFVFSMVKAWPHVRRDESDIGSSGMSSRYAFFLGAASGLFALAVHSLVDFNLHIPANALAGVVLLALASSQVRFATKRYWVRARLPAQMAATGAIAAGAIYLGVQGFRRAGETLWAARSEHRENYSSDQAQTLEKALAIEPKNSLTVYNIGEIYRIQSWEGGSNYVQMAQQALDFYRRGAELDPHDAYFPLRIGMCLDWLGKHAEAEKYYAEAEIRDPNGNFVVCNIGWHYVQIGDYPAARQWFLRANKLANGHNDTARNYIYEICRPRLIQRASGQLPMRFFYNGKGD